MSPQEVVMESMVSKSFKVAFALGKSSFCVADLHSRFEQGVYVMSMERVKSAETA